MTHQGGGFNQNEEPTAFCQGVPTLHMRTTRMRLGLSGFTYCAQCIREETPRDGALSDRICKLIFV